MVCRPHRLGCPQGHLAWDVAWAEAMVGMIATEIGEEDMVTVEDTETVKAAMVKKDALRVIGAVAVEGATGVALVTGGDDTETVMVADVTATGLLATMEMISADPTMPETGAGDRRVVAGDAWAGEWEVDTATGTVTAAALDSVTSTAEEVDGVATAAEVLATLALLT
mmetsp:Transcript_14851/g.29164  ORF Transcript_14851/g.29164 Transcript_14851/m.29164 type:complete len:168 (-) Transcript_14851:1415-1918(-)